MNNLHFQKIIFGIDNIFFYTLKTIIDQVINKYSNVPIQWEDIYYSFLYKSPNVIFNFNQNLGISFKTFLGLQCKFYTRTYIKHFITKKYKILNERYDWEKSINHPCLLDYYPEDEEIFAALDYVDSSKFTMQEYLIFNERYVKGKKINQIVKDTSLKYHKINSLSKSIKSKVKRQLNLKQN